MIRTYEYMCTIISICVLICVSIYLLFKDVSAYCVYLWKYISLSSVLSCLVYLTPPFHRTPSSQQTKWTTKQLIKNKRNKSKTKKKTTAENCPSNPWRPRCALRYHTLVEVLHHLPQLKKGDFPPMIHGADIFHLPSLKLTLWDSLFSGASSR